MRHFAILFSRDARRQLERIRARAPTPALDAALAKAFMLLQACPEMAPPAKLGGKWSRNDHSLVLGETGYLMFYRVNPSAELVLVRAIRHQSQRPLKRL